MFRVTVVTIVTIAVWASLTSGAEKREPIGGSWRSSAARSDVRRTDETSSSGIRSREGSSIDDQLGTIVESGRRYWFKPADGGESMRILENLALDRIVHMIEDTRTDHLWSISGTVTEYQGENYLLVRRSVLTSRRARPVAGGR